MNYKDDWFVDFIETTEWDLSKERLAGVINDFIKWKQNKWAARWKKEYFIDGRCSKCGGNNLKHEGVKWEGRDSLWNICPSIWKTDCPDCKTRFVGVSNDDGDLLENWEERLD